MPRAALGDGCGHDRTGVGCIYRAGGETRLAALADASAADRDDAREMHRRVFGLEEDQT